MKPISTPFASSLTGASLVSGITAACLLSMLLFGYDQGVLGGIINDPDFQHQFPQLVGPENSNLLGTVVAIYEVGAFFGSVAFSIWGSLVGRRRTVMLGAFLVTIGGAIQAGATNLPMLIVFRIIAGIGIGLSTSIVMTYHAECVRPKHRGMLVNMNLVGAGAGLSTSYWLTYGLSFVNSPVSWRFPVAFQCFFSLAVFILMFWLPESPRWLAEQNCISEAYTVLSRLTTPDEADITLAEIQAAIALERRLAREVQERAVAASSTLKKSSSDPDSNPGLLSRYWVCFQNNDQHFRYRTLLSIGALFFQQMSGINVCTYYQAVVFQNYLHLSRNMSLLLSGFNGLNSLLFVAVASFLCVDRFGRVRLMWWTAAGQCLMMIILAAVVRVNSTRGEGIAATVAIFIYFGPLFSLGWLGPSWLYPAEISPLAIRSQSTALASASNWIWNFLVVEITPVGLANLSGRYFIIWAVFNGIAAPTLYLFYPETARLKLEEIDELFPPGKVHVRRSPREPVARVILDVQQDSVAEKGAGLANEDDKKSDEERIETTTI